MAKDAKEIIAALAAFKTQVDAGFSDVQTGYARLETGVGKLAVDMQTNLDLLKKINESGPVFSAQDQIDIDAGIASLTASVAQSKALATQMATLGDVIDKTDALTPDPVVLPPPV